MKRMRNMEEKTKMKKTISIKDIRGIRIGQTENLEGGTGCTVFLSETGMAAGLDVRGGGPASRESELLKPLAPPRRSMPLCWPGEAPLGWSCRRCDAVSGRERDWF